MERLAESQFDHNPASESALARPGRWLLPDNLAGLKSAAEGQRPPDLPGNSIIVYLTRPSGRAMPEIPKSSGPVEALVDAGRLRVAAQVRHRECFLALAVVVFGVCALLFFGTRYVPFALLPLAAGFGVWAAIQRWGTGVPDGYSIAQRIDAHEALADAFSTAYYFRTTGSASFATGVADSQYRRASRAAEAIAPEGVFPGGAPGTQRVSLWLGVAATLLFGLRVAVQPQVSLEPPLAPLLAQALFGYEPERPSAAFLAALEMRDEAGPGPSQDETRLPDVPPGETDPIPEELPEERYDGPLDESEAPPEVEGLITLPLEELAADGLLEESQEGGPLDPGPDQDDSADAIPPDPHEEGWNQEAQSLLDKLKQAFENMLQTLDMASVESADSEAGSEQGSGTSEESPSAGDPADSGDTSESAGSEMADASMEGGEPGAESGETASASGNSGQNSDGEQSSGENASAAGTSDGSKEFEEAEQLEVLGALEELYMERAERMRGDMTVETRLAEQSASVPYQQRATTHADRGGAVSRDEIPAAYRMYIQNYFEALRKNGM